MFQHRSIMLLIALGLCSALAACGSNPASDPQVRASAPSAPTRSATPVPTDAVPAIVATYRDLPSSQTPEGYYVLGQPNAPVTITYYSDFL